MRIAAGERRTMRVDGQRQCFGHLRIECVPRRRHLDGLERMRPVPPAWAIRSRHRYSGTRRLAPPARMRYPHPGCIPRRTQDSLEREGSPRSGGPPQGLLQGRSRGRDPRRSPDVERFRAGQVTERSAGCFRDPRSGREPQHARLFQGWWKCGTIQDSWKKNVVFEVDAWI